ncbi:MAG: C4-type zinc ribbon domain-containing protein, partial [Planctomycetota bacterium]
DLRTRVKEIEDAAFGKRERIKKIEKAAGESRGDASLHANYEHEKRSLMRELGRGDDEALKFMERVEGIEKEMAERRTALEGMQSEFDEYSANVDAEMAEAQSKVDELDAARTERLSKDLKPETLELYDRLIIARDGDAMAALEGNVCQGCYMSVPANTYVRLMRGVEIMQCPSCDRILYPA